MTVLRIFEAGDVMPTLPYIPRGKGQSFSDAAFLSHGQSLSSEALQDLGEINLETMTCRFGAGVSMEQMHRYLAQNGHEFAVYGGNQRVSLGGAVASDIHGKNHVHAGSFGHYVAGLRLITPSGLCYCSPTENTNIFAATVGGMGLTGMITHVDVKIRAQSIFFLQQTRTKLQNLEEMEQAFSRDAAPYQLASWLDLSAKKPCGFFYSATPEAEMSQIQSGVMRRPYDMPYLPRIQLLSKTTLWLAAQIGRLTKSSIQSRQHVFNINYSGAHERFNQWNHLMGQHGFIEYQFCLNETQFSPALKHIVLTAQRQSVALLCAVIKRFGNKLSTGLLSFPQHGFTVNFQLATTQKNFTFLNECSNYLNSLGARFYLAKDACLSPDQYALSCPQLAQWQAIVRLLDPKALVVSDLSQRLKLKPW